MQKSRDTLMILQTVQEEIERTVGSRPAETGGLLGMRDGVVCAYYFDESADCTDRAYRPDTTACEHVANAQWQPAGIYVCGFVHSHASDMRPSRSDVQYAQALYDAICLTDAAVARGFYLLIASATHHGVAFSLHPYQGLYRPNGEFVVLPVDMEAVDAT